jgi:metal transporter CNNM
MELVMSISWNNLSVCSWSVLSNLVHFCEDVNLVWMKTLGLKIGLLCGRVGSDMPLYDILNEFQKGGSHLAAVVKAKSKRKDDGPSHEESAKDGLDDCKQETGEADLEKGIQIVATGDKRSDKNGPEIISRNLEENGKREIRRVRFSEPQQGSTGQADDVKEGEVIGIITMEDVMEELLQVSVNLRI